MTSYQSVQSLRKNPVIKKKQHRVNWVVIQCLVFGLLLGIMIRAAWDYGVITSIALAFRDLGFVIWVMLQDAAAACWDFCRFILKSVNS